MIGAGAPATLYQRVNDLLALTAYIAFRALVGVLVLFLAADVGRIGFNDLAFAAQRASRRK